MNGITDPKDVGEDGQLVCWGCGEFGQHGHNHKRDVEYSEGIIAQFSQSWRDRVKLLSCGASHTVVVTNSNEIFVWGNGNSGQLGCSDKGINTNPQRLTLNSADKTAPNVISVACGGRHTMVCLENGNVYSFGNNSNAQLGFDFRKENFKKNQIMPYLLSFFVYRPVAQVACGDKHSVFRFEDGGLRCVGNNAHGQIGSDNREDALEPKCLKHEKKFKYIACGAHHSLAITVDGEVFVWGLGKACGDKSGDILYPVRLLLHRSNIIQVSGGSRHSMALTDSGVVYTWGCGSNGQLGHGEKVCYSSKPKKLKFSNANHRVVQIASGEHVCAAVTENGGLFMWGKSGHTISSEKPPSQKYFTPTCVNQNQLPVHRMVCGSWHGIALTGVPDFHLQEDNFSADKLEDDCASLSESMASSDSKISDLPGVKDISECLNYQSDSTESELAALTTPDCEHGLKVQREKTRVSLAEFYAPTPDIVVQGFDNIPGVEKQMAPTETCVCDYPANRTVSRCSTKLIVQVPSSTEPQYVDVATSPIPISSSGTETTSTSGEAQELTFTNPSPTPITIQETNTGYSPEWTAAHQQSKSLSFLTRPKILQDESAKFSNNQNKFRSKSCLVHNSSKFVQVSNTTADNFVLPRENTSLSSKNIDFSEMEIARVIGARKFPRRLLKTGKLVDPSGLHDPSIPSFVKPKTDEDRFVTASVPLKHGTVKNWSRSFGFDVSAKTVFVSAPQTDGHDDSWHLSNSMKVDKENIGLQITRSQTVIGPLRNSLKSSNTRIHQLQHYRNVHNPGTSNVFNAFNADAKVPPKIMTQRHVSIPGRRLPYLHNDADNLFINGRMEVSKKRTFPGAMSWKVKSNMQCVSKVTRMKSSSASNTSSVSTSSKESNEVDTMTGGIKMSSDVEQAGGNLSTKRIENGDKLQLHLGDSTVQDVIYSNKIPGFVADADSNPSSSRLNCVDTYDLSDILDTRRTPLFPDMNPSLLKVAGTSQCRDHTKITRPMDKSDFAKKLISIGNSQST